jgi:NAD(P)-dependent dehydrogenase (short-subunit alcohol dehydrogenase family)
VSIDIRGKWALVTGSSRGIGREIARGLAAKGCNLVLHGRLREHNASLAVELGKSVKVAVVAAELSVEADVDRLVREAQHASAGIGVLYNNAAIMTPFCQDYATVTADDYRRSFEVNVIAPVRITHGLLPHMLERRFGRIVQVTSGIRDQPELMAYAASKAALDKFVRDTVIRLRDTGVTMNLLDPGWLRTDLGGPNAPNAVESVMPGALVPALVENDVQGAWFSAQDYAR